MRSPYAVTEWRCACGETWEAVVQWPCRRCGQLPDVTGPATMVRGRIGTGAVAVAQRQRSAVGARSDPMLEDLNGFRPDERWAVRAYGE